MILTGIAYIWPRKIFYWQRKRGFYRAPFNWTLTPRSITFLVNSWRAICRCVNNDKKSMRHSLHGCEHPCFQCREAVTLFVETVFVHWYSWNFTRTIKDQITRVMTHGLNGFIPRSLNSWFIHHNTAMERDNENILSTLVKYFYTLCTKAIRFTIRI